MEPDDGPWRQGSSPEGDLGFSDPLCCLYLVPARGSYLTDETLRSRAMGPSQSQADSITKQSKGESQEQGPGEA